MSEATASSNDEPARDRRRTFAWVILTEAIVIAALWAFSRQFGS